MVAPDDHDPSDNTPETDELAEKLARLSKERRTHYQTHIDIRIELNGDASREYRQKLADTLLQNFSAREESRQIQELNRREEQKDYWRDQGCAAERAAQTILPAPERPGGERVPDRQPAAAQIEPREPPRDYGALQRAHEQVTVQPNAQTRRTGPEPATQSVEPPPPILSKQQFALMIEHFPDIRREANIITTQSEIRESAELARVQNADEREVEQRYKARPHPRQSEEIGLLDHQHLAERAGVQARWIAQHLKAQGSPDADTYGNDSRAAFATRQTILQQRRGLQAIIENSQDAAHVVQADQQQKQAEAQAAAGGAIDLTSEQLANAAPNLRQVIERKQRSDAKREVLRDSRDQTMQQGKTKPGNSRGGGRSR